MCGDGVGSEREGDMRGRKEQIVVVEANEDELDKTESSGGR